MKMWSQVKGSGAPLLMLHPGGVDSRAFESIEPLLISEYALHYVDRRAHGRTPDVEGPLHFNDMVDDIIEYIEAECEKPINVFGFSDGAIVALMLTIKRPDLVNKVICAAGVYHYEGWQDGVLKNLSVVPEFMKKMYGKVSPDGVGHYDTVVSKMSAMHQSEPAVTEAELRSFENDCLVMVADDDEVKLEHALKWYRSLKNGELAVVPGTSHGMFVEKPELFSQIVIDFLNNLPIQTVAPIARKELT